MIWASRVRQICKYCPTQFKNPVLSVRVLSKLKMLTSTTSYVHQVHVYVSQQFVGSRCWDRISVNSVSFLSFGPNLDCFSFCTNCPRCHLAILVHIYRQKHQPSWTYWATVSSRSLRNKSPYRSWVAWSAARPSLQNLSVALTWFPTSPIVSKSQWKILNNNTYDITWMKAGQELTLFEHYITNVA